MRAKVDEVVKAVLEVQTSTEHRQRTGIRELPGLG